MYLKENEVKAYVQPYLKQSFKNQFRANIDKREILKLRHENVITNRDMEIILFLFRFKFITMGQLEKYFKNEYTQDSLRNRMEKLIKYRLLNKFAFSAYEEEKLPPNIDNDVFFVFCLDIGSKFLLEAYSNLDVYDWYTSDNLHASEVIAKYLASVDFYLALTEEFSERLVYSEGAKVYRVFKQGIHIPLTFALNTFNTNQYFVVDIVGESDYPLNFKNKVEKLELLLATRGWMRYFHDSLTVPTLLLVCENDRIAYQAALMLAESSDVSTENFKLTTIERLKNGNGFNSPGTFLRFDQNEMKLFQVKFED